VPNPLSETQTDQVREMIRTEMRPVVRRMWIWGGTIIVAIAIASTIGIYGYSRTHSDIRAVSCQRAQAFSIGLRLVVHTAIPPNDAPEAKHRTAAERAQVANFYRKVGPALKVPSCS
jgi:hypothetical protein